MIQSCITIYSLGNVDQLITHRTDTFNCMIYSRTRRPFCVILTYSYFRFMRYAGIWHCVFGDYRLEGNCFILVLKAIAV